MTWFEMFLLPLWSHDPTCTGKSEGIGTTPKKKKVMEQMERIKTSVNSFMIELMLNLEEFFIKIL